MNSDMYVFEGEAKKTVKINFLTQEQLRHEMNELLKHYKTNMSNADLNKTRKIFGTTSLSDELSEMREENR